MRKLPYENEYFDKVICLWSSFNHLLTQKEQVSCLNEVYRILKIKGKFIVELPNAGTKEAKKIISEKGKGENSRIVTDKIAETDVTNYWHDKNTLTRISEESKFKKFKTKITKIGDRERLIWLLEK